MLGEKLSLLRKSKKITQLELSQSIGISRQAYNNYENNRREPDYQLINQFAEYFDVSTDYLLGVDNSTNKNTHLSETDRRVQQLFEEKPIMRDLVDAISRLDESQQLALLEYAEFQAQKYKQKD